MEQEQHRHPWVPQSTLETEVPLPLYSDQALALRGPRQAPLLQQALRWKVTPMGRDAVGQSWSPGPSGRQEEGEQPWYSLDSTSTHRPWQRAPAARGERQPLAPALAQHLREVAWWDPVVPAAYPGPRTRWGPFLWQDRPIPGKEYAVTRSQSPQAPGDTPGYVPLLSFCRPPGTAQDISTWSLLHHQPSTHQ